MATTPIDERLRPSELEGKPLGEHDGVEITRSAAKITKTGDGLSESLHMAPVHLPIGSEVFVVVPAKVVSHEYDYVKEGRDLVEDERVETAVLEATGAFFVDPDLVDEVTKAHFERIHAHREQIRREAEERKGITHLPLDDGGPGSPDGDGGD